MDGRLRMCVLITGANGQLARAFRHTLSDTTEVVALSRAELDLADELSVRQAIRAFQPRVIINAGAYTAVDAAETDEELAHKVNSLAPGILADEAAHLGACLIHFSTDYVFDGRQSTPYEETDVAAPINVYGATKLEGEARALDRWEKTTVFRVSWLYYVRGHNFLRTMLRLAETRDRLTVVDDQHGAPTWVYPLAKGVSSLVRGDLAQEDREHGLFHLPSGGHTTWCKFARAILRHAGLEVTVEAIDTAAYPTPAKRPAYSLLSGEKAGVSFGLRLPDWQLQLQDAMRRLTPS